MSKWSSVKRGYRYVAGHRIYFDSKAEANYYRYLNFLKSNHAIKDFEYHPPYFSFEQWVKFGVRRYELDFSITENNGFKKFIEIKGTDDLKKMDPKSRTKLTRMSKFYPQIKIDVVSTNHIRQIGHQVGGLVPDWEF